MGIPSIEELMTMDVAEAFGSEPVPIGDYNAVITGAEVRPGKKAPYISVETTIFDGDYERRKVWRNVSFSDKALGMPGGLANVMQSAKPELDRELKADELPAAVAAGIISSPVSITVKHDQVVRQGTKQFTADGQAEMRAEVSSFGEPTPEFVKAFEDMAAGVDDDLPF